MKKSEALSIIHEYLKVCKETSTDPQPKNILGLLEQAGMLPPSYKKIVRAPYDKFVESRNVTRFSPWTGGYIATTYAPNYYEANEWEPEDVN